MPRQSSARAGFSSGSNQRPVANNPKVRASVGIKDANRKVLQMNLPTTAGYVAVPMSAMGRSGH